MQGPLPQSTDNFVKLPQAAYVTDSAFVTGLRRAEDGSLQYVTHTMYIAVVHRQSLQLPNHRQSQ